MNKRINITVEFHSQDQIDRFVRVLHGKSDVLLSMENALELAIDPEGTLTGTRPWLDIDPDEEEKLIEFARGS
jgi:hypothetical protein